MTRSCRRDREVPCLKPGRGDFTKEVLDRFNWFAFCTTRQQFSLVVQMRLWWLQDGAAMSRHEKRKAGPLCDPPYARLSNMDHRLPTRQLDHESAGVIADVIVVDAEIQAAIRRHRHVGCRADRKGLSVVHSTDQHATGHAR